jgi:hypothetical protein
LTVSIISTEKKAHESIRDMFFSYQFGRRWPMLMDERLCSAD